MSSLLRQGLLGLKTLAEAAAKKVEEVEAQNLQNKTTGSVDAEKVKVQLDEKQKTIDTMAAAIDQLQQRVSNLEAQMGRLEAKKPVQRTPPPTGGAGGWIDQPPKNKL